MSLSDKELAKVDRKENLSKRPSWDEYYVTIAFVVAQRSFDPSTKCGCVIVSKDNRVLSTGYNGPLKGSTDENIPLTRDLRYHMFLHSEENALLAYNGSQRDIQDATAYVNSLPCHKCLRMLLQKGITRIVYSDVKKAKCVDKIDLKAQKMMLKDRKVEIKVIFSQKIADLLEKTKGVFNE